VIAGINLFVAAAGFLHCCRAQQNRLALRPCPSSAVAMWTRGRGFARAVVAAVPKMHAREASARARVVRQPPARPLRGTHPVCSVRNASARGLSTVRGVGGAGSVETAGGGGGNFLRSLVLEEAQRKEVETGAPYRVALRFPPEPNGFLHIGHAKSICLNFGLAEELRGMRGGATCFLRFDDTNPASAHQRYADAIMEDVRWLGFEWDGPARFTSDYFPVLHAFAEELIKRGDAYVCSLSRAEMAAMRGTPTQPGRPCRYVLRLFFVVASVFLFSCCCFLSFSPSSPQFIAVDDKQRFLKLTEHRRKEGGKNAEKNRVRTQVPAAAFDGGEPGDFPRHAGQ
jgi:hypothetical protein